MPRGEGGGGDRYAHSRRFRLKGLFFQASGT